MLSELIRRDNLQTPIKEIDRKRRERDRELRSQILDSGFQGFGDIQHSTVSLCIPLCFLFSG
jgi:hypothetical protein